MKPCLKTIQIFCFVFAAFIFSENARAQEEAGYCNDWCGKQGNKAWWAVMNSHGVTTSSSEAEKDPYRAAANLAKNAEDAACKQRSLGMTRAECDGKSAATADVPVPTANPNRCESEYTQKVKACEDQISSSQRSCDSNSSSAFASSGSGSSSSEGIADACKKSASLSGSAKDAWTSFKNSCSSAMNSCMDACAEISTWAQNNPTCFPLPSSGLTAAQINQNIYSPKISQCMDLQSTVDTATKNASTYSDTAATSAECESSTTGGTSSNNLGGLAQTALGLASGMLASKKTETAAAVQSFCQTNPAYPGCSSSASLNCTDPTQAATNKVCICATSPRDPQCMTAQSASSNVSGGAMIDSSSRLPSQVADNLSGDIPATNVDPLSSKLNNSGSAEGIDGRQGGAPVGNSTVGSGGGPGGRGGGSPSTTGDLPGAGGGFYGGGGGSGGKGFGSSGTASSGGYRPQGAGGGAGAGTPGGPDLRQFLPGGMQDPRSRGMIGGVGTDGITGPHTNIWHKVQNRYQILKDSLYP